MSSLIISVKSIRCVVPLRKMWKALAVTSANWERFIWTPLTLKAAPSASALEPLTAAAALTNGGVRYSPKDKELLFNKLLIQSPLYMNIYTTVRYR